MPRAPCRTRPVLIQFCACLNPSPSSPMRFSTGTRTLSKAISHGRSSIIVCCARSSFTPFDFISTMKRRDAAVRALGAVGRGEHLAPVGLVGAGDEALHAVEDIVVAVAHRGRAHGAGIAAGIGLGLGEAPFDLAANGGNEEAPLLLVIEVVEDRADVGPENLRGARRERDAARHLGPHHDLGEKPQSEPAIFLRHVVIAEPKLLRLRLEMAAHVGLELGPVARLALDRDELAIDEFAHRLLQHPEFFRQLEIHAVCRVHRILTCRGREGAHRRRARRGPPPAP